MHNFENKLSVKGKFWQVIDFDENYVKSACQKFSISDFLARILSQKNIPLNEIPNFLEPKIRDYLPNPYLLKDMQKAVERIIFTIINNQKIAIYGDYDVDGASATALLVRFFRGLKSEILFHIPDRIKEGYGVNFEALKNLKNQGADLVISVDCGVLAFEPILKAKNIGLDVIVIDHHLSDAVLPEAVAVVNPNRLDDDSKLNNLCATGVAFLVCVAINSELKKQKYYCNTSIEEINLLHLLDLVSLATICDVMSLTGVNRAFVKQGLKILAERRNLGLSALMDISGLKNAPDVYSLGFLIGPRINAAGRISDCSLGAKILSEENQFKALEYAETLNNLNKERQEIEQNIFIEALEMASKKDENLACIVLASKNWHQGVIGIVAGKIKEIFDKPTAIIALNEGVGKASARSVNGIDFGSGIINAKNDGLILAGGGHKMAAGFSILEENIKKLEEYLHQKFLEDYKIYQSNKYVKANLVLPASALTLELADEISKLSPFGIGNSEPLILVENVKIVSLKTYAEKHIGFYFSDANLAKVNSKSVKGILFNGKNTTLGNALEENYMKNVSLLGKIRKNSFNNSEYIDFFLEDVVIN
ncbi:MAG: single-stranded-DNA-specific exonuclease RecJ [Rickettsiales bacterium]|nr:single-stranded-DNA-specific exonuclease RecJ [Rickettsiales bacterium]